MWVELWGRNEMRGRDGCTEVAQLAIDNDLSRVRIDMDAAELLQSNDAA